MKSNRKLSIVLSLLVCALVLRAPAASHAQELNMLYMAQAGYQPSDIQDRARAFEEETGVPVDVHFAEYEDQYNLIMESMEKSEADYDVILLDLIWTADFAERRIIDPIPPGLAQEVRRDIVPEIHSAFEYGGQIWALPFLANFKLFYTNMALLHRAGFTRPPQTLEELVSMATAAKEKGVIEYPIFLPLRKQEALICEFVWLTGAFGGDLLDEDGRIDVAAPAARSALSFLVELLDRGLLNPYSLQSEEVFAAEVFTSGDALFEANWTFLVRLMNEAEPPISRVGEATLIPAARAVRGNGTRTSTVSGFQGLAVTRNSALKEDAWRFIRFLSSPEFQRDHLEEMSVWSEVWSEPSTIERDPDIDLKRRQLGGVHHRPIHPAYRSISDRLQYWVYEALRGAVEPETALRNAQAEINQIVTGGASTGGP